MGRDISKELDRLKNSILYLGASVEGNLQKAITSFLENDIELAREVKRNDAEINGNEVRLEEQCLSVMALHQPVAGDLRFIVTVLRINIDLERIGDLTVNIADKVVKISLSRQQGNMGSDLAEIKQKFHAMFDATQLMVNKCLEAFVNEDADLAYKIILADEQVDSAKSSIRALLEETIQKEPAKHVHLALLLSVSRSLERIADHATNISEDIIYMLQGRIIRHMIDSPV